MKTKKLTLMLAAFLATAITFCGTSHADVVAEVSVPSGTTNFYSLVRWTLKQPGELPVGFEIEVSPGMTASDIALSMALEADNVFGIDASSLGTTFVATGVTGTLVTVPAEVDIDWSTTSVGGGIGPDVALDLDFVSRQRDPIKVIVLILIMEMERAAEHRFDGFIQSRN
ncbi:MAG: hypothetical protein AAFX06_22155 [Planctomycetota bacterium]